MMLPVKVVVPKVPPSLALSMAIFMLCTSVILLAE